MLKRKKLIYNKYEFKLTLEAVDYLENDFKDFKSNLLSAISIPVASMALSINIFVNQNILSLIVLMFILIFFIILFYYIRKL